MAPRHPPRQRSRADEDEDDRSPFDMCGWCFRWIRAKSQREFVTLGIDPPLPPGTFFHELSISGRTVLSMSPAVLDLPDEARAHRESDQVFVVLCGPDCAAALTQGIGDDEARARGETPPSRVTPKERRRAERLLRTRCAWCRDDLGDATLVLYARLESREDRSPGERMLAVNLGGRLVAGTLPKAGSDAEREGWDVVFACCSQSCANRITEAVALARVH